MERPATIAENGREKAYRPLSAADRRAAFDAGVRAYDAGDVFLAHERLEPAWMGASDPAERALHAGLIKVAAAFVHLARGNPAGIDKNLAGAVARLERAGPAGPGYGIDVSELLRRVEAALAAVRLGQFVDRIPLPRLEVRTP
ncbi:MAG: DUF309 domain-containing protein [Candidatus Limnocylindrales bacterium]